MRIMKRVLRNHHHQRARAPMVMVVVIPILPQRGIDLSVTNALTAARWLLVPVECSFMALDGYEHVHALQQRLNARINPELDLLGLLPTRYRSGTAHAQAALEEIQQQAEALQVPLRFAPIQLAVAAVDAPAHGMTLADFAPTSMIAQEYRHVAEQLIAFLETSHDQ